MQIPFCALLAHCLGLSSGSAHLQVARATEAENFSKKELVRLGEELEESKAQRVSGTQGVGEAACVSDVKY